MPSKPSQKNNNKVESKTAKVSANDEQEELSALIRSIKLSQKYYLYFVDCNQVPYQDKLIKQIKSELAEKQIEVIKFKKPITNLLQEITPLLKDKTPDAVFIQGLEYSISSDGKGKENALIHRLNLSRDAFNDALPCPIYLWLPSYAIIKIVRNAPDYFSVRSGVFYFSAPAEKVIGDIFSSTSSEWMETSNLPIAKKQIRIANLESLLAEYQGLHEEKRDKRAEMRLYSQLGNLFYSISEYRKVIEYAEKSLMIAKEINAKKGESNSLNDLGNAYLNLGNYLNAIEYYEKALEISYEIGDQKGESIHLNNLGIAYNKMGNYDQAIEYYKKALEMSRKLNNRHGETNSLGSLGNVYNRLGNYQKAIEYYKDALAISQKLDNRKKEGSQLGSLGNVYRNLGDYHTAIDFHKQALIISKQIGHRQGEGNRLGNLGNDYFSLGDKQKARDYWLQAIEILESIESPQAEIFKRNLTLLESESES